MAETSVYCSTEEIPPGQSRQRQEIIKTQDFWLEQFKEKCCNFLHSERRKVKVSQLYRPQSWSLDHFVKIFQILYQPIIPQIFYHHETFLSQLQDCYVLWLVPPWVWVFAPAEDCDGVARLDLLPPHRQTDGRHEVRQLQGSGQLDQGEVIGEAAGVPGRVDHCAVGGDLDLVIWGIPHTRRQSSSRHIWPSWIFLFYKDVKTFNQPN